MIPSVFSLLWLRAQSTFMLLLLTALGFLSVPMIPSVFKTRKNMKSLHNLNSIYCSCTSLFMAFTKEIAGKMNKFAQIWFFQVCSLVLNLACALVFIFAVVFYWGWFIAVHVGCVLHLASCHYYWHHHQQFSAPYLQLIGLSEVCELPLGIEGITWWPLLMAFFSLQSLWSGYFSPMYLVLSNWNNNISSTPLPWYIWGRLNISYWIRTSNL